eukprot:169997_1
MASMTSFVFVLITSLIPSQSQLCYPQYRCDPGYMDRINGNPQTWACGVDCIGGRHLTDSSCGCACIPASTCAWPDTTCTTCAALPISISYHYINQFTMQTPTKTTILTAGDAPIFDAPGANAHVALSMTCDLGASTWCSRGRGPCSVQLILGVNDIPDACVNYNQSSEFLYDDMVAIANVTVSLNFTSDGTPKRIFAQISESEDYSTSYSCYDRNPDVVIWDVGYINGIITDAPSNPSVAPTMHPVTAKPTIDPTTVKPTTDPTTAKPTADPITAKPTTNPVTVQPTMGPVTVEPTIDPTTVKPTKNLTASPISVHSTMRADQMNENINIASMMSSATIVVSLIIAIVACVICLAVLIIIYVIRKQALDANSQCINNINQQPIAKNVDQSNQPTVTSDLQTNSDFVSNEGDICDAPVNVVELELSESSSNDELWETQPTTAGNITHTTDGNENQVAIARSATINDKIVKGVIQTRGE